MSDKYNDLAAGILGDAVGARIGFTGPRGADSITLHSLVGSILRAVDREFVERKEPEPVEPPQPDQPALIREAWNAAIVAACNVLADGRDDMRLASVNDAIEAVRALRRAS